MALDTHSHNAIRYNVFVCIIIIQTKTLGDLWRWTHFPVRAVSPYTTHQCHYASQIVTRQVVSCHHAASQIVRSRSCPRRESARPPRLARTWRVRRPASPTPRPRCRAAAGTRCGRVPTSVPSCTTRQGPARRAGSPGAPRTLAGRATAGTLSRTAAARSPRMVVQARRGNSVAAVAADAAHTTARDRPSGGSTGAAPWPRQAQQRPHGMAAPPCCTARAPTGRRTHLRRHQMVLT